jgi:hypothetical protein
MVRSGGRYAVDKGKARRVDCGARPHAEGSAPRDAEGRRLDRPAEPPPATPAEGE